jgi:hypothetical protein
VPWLDALTLETVIVHTDSASFKGLKAAVHDDCIVLRDACCSSLSSRR